MAEFTPSNQVGAYEAKTHLAEFLERASQGERITITRHGAPVAVLVPPETPRTLTVDAAIEQIRGLQRRLRLGEPLAELIREGRR